MKADGRRGLRVAELLRARFAETARRELDDPALSLLSVADVDVTADLELADVRVCFLGVENEGEQKRLLERLRRAVPRLRRALAGSLGMRRAPELRLHLARGADAAQRVDELLDEIQRERPPESSK